MSQGPDPATKGDNLAILLHLTWDEFIKNSPHDCWFRGYYLFWALSPQNANVLIGSIAVIFIYITQVVSRWNSQYREYFSHLLPHHFANTNSCPDSGVCVVNLLTPQWDLGALRNSVIYRFIQLLNTIHESRFLMTWQTSRKLMKEQLWERVGIFKDILLILLLYCHLFTAFEGLTK